MAGGFAANRKNDIMEYVFRGGAAAAQGTVYVSLHTANPTDSATTASGNELTGGSYARQSVTTAQWTAASAGNIDNTQLLSFDLTGVSDGTITHFGLWNHATNSTATEYVFFGDVNPDKAFVNGNTVEIPVGALDLTLQDS